MPEDYTSAYDDYLNRKDSLLNIRLGDTSVQDLLDMIANSGAYDFTGSISGKSTLDVAGAFGTPADGTESTVITDLINARLDTSAKEILGEFVFSGSGAIAMATDASNGLWLSPTGILGKKAGVTTFAIDTSGNATFKGDISGSSGTFSGTVSADNITAGTLTGSLIRTSSGTTRVQLEPSGTYANSLTFYYNSSIAGQVQNFGSGLEIVTPTGAGNGIFLYGGNSLGLSVTNVSATDAVATIGHYMKFNDTYTTPVPNAVSAIFFWSDGADTFFVGEPSSGWYGSFDLTAIV